MINTFMRMRLEREFTATYNALRERILSEPDFADILEQKQAVYLPIDLGANWNCTIGLCDTQYLAAQQYGSYTEYTVELVLRHKTLPDTYYADLVLNVEYGNGQRLISVDPKMTMGNVPTHVEYELMLGIFGQITDAIAGLDFSTALTVFGKAVTP